MICLINSFQNSNQQEALRRITIIQPRSNAWGTIYQHISEKKWWQKRKSNNCLHQVQLLSTRLCGPRKAAPCGRTWKSDPEPDGGWSPPSWMGNGNEWPERREEDGKLSFLFAISCLWGVCLQGGDDTEQNSEIYWCSGTKTIGG